MLYIILSGGFGTRLFPLSREKFPKQFLSIGNNKSLFQKTLQRIEKAAGNMSNMVIITNENYKFYIKNQLREMVGERNFNNIVLEPATKNTAPAIALAVSFVLKKLHADEDEILFIAPSDHIISPESKFVEYAKQAEEIAKKGYVVTFGIKPTKPETAYGYIESDTTLCDGKFHKVLRFREKPNLETAKNYLEKGNYYWNSGMFAFSIKTILEEFRNYSPEIFDIMKDNSFEEVINNFDKMPNISIDYAVMENTKKAVVLPVDIFWSDVGSWDSVYDVLNKDKDNNVSLGNTIGIDTTNSLIMSNGRFVAAIGIKDTIIVETKDVILAIKRGESQKIKGLVNILKNTPKTRELTEFHKTVYRPWGSYTELERGQRYKIKKITVNPQEKLSLQMHYHRSEHWVVIKGTAKVILEENDGNLKEFYIHENESTFVPKTTKHRLMNPGEIPLEIIEVQVGEYVGEDDIVRFEDEYGRKK